MTIALKPCPFCGDPEPIVERYGTSRVSSVIICGNCGVTVEANETTAGTGEQWNGRPAEVRPLQPLRDYLTSEQSRAAACRGDSVFVAACKDVRRHTLTDVLVWLDRYEKGETHVSLESITV